MSSNKTRNLWMGTLVLAGDRRADQCLRPAGRRQRDQDRAGPPAAVAAPPVAANPAPVATPEPAADAGPGARRHPGARRQASPGARGEAGSEAGRQAVVVAAVEPTPEVKVAAAPPSNTVGAVKQIDPITDTNATGAGAVAGGVLGGVVGHQFGQGNGKKAMTLLGAVGGAVAGHQVEKAVTTKVIGYRVQVQLDNGETRTFESAQLDGLKVGDRVRVEQGQLRRV